DAVTLARVYRELERQRGIRARKAVLVNLLDYLGLALALEQGAGSKEQDILFKLAKFYTLGRYSDALAFYEMERERTGGSAPPVDEVIKRLGGPALMTRLRTEPDPAQRYPAAVARLRALMDEPSSSPPDPLSPMVSSPPDPLSTKWRGGTLEENIDRLLERVALSTSDGIEVAPDRVNLLTLHSTKGLEFSRVYIVGVEDYQIPGLRETKANHQPLIPRWAIAKNHLADGLRSDPRCPAAMLFSTATLTFLRGLKRHNDRVWFEAHRAEYEAVVKRPMRELIEEMDVRMARFAPEVV